MNDNSVSNYTFTHSTSNEERQNIFQVVIALFGIFKEYKNILRHYHTSLLDKVIQKAIRPKPSP